MKGKINNYKILDIAKEDDEAAKRLAKCWNILRTMSDEQSESLERQVDAIIEDGTMVVGVNIVPEFPF